MQFTVGGMNNNMGATTGAAQTTTIAGQNGLPQAGLVDTTVGGNNMIGINSPSNNITVGGTNNGAQASPTGMSDLAAAAMAAINGINGGTAVGATQPTHQAMNIGATQPMVNPNQTVQTQQVGATAQVGQTNVMGGQTNMNQNGQVSGIVGAAPNMTTVPNNGQGNISFNGNLSTIENALSNIAMGIGNLSNTILTAVILAAKGGVGGLNLGGQIQQTTPMMTQPATPQNNMFNGTSMPMTTSTTGIGGLPMTTTAQPQMQAVNPMVGTSIPQQMTYTQTTPMNTTPMTGAMPQVQIGGMNNMMTTPMTTTPMNYQSTPNMFAGATTPMTQPMMNNQMGGIPGMVATQPQMNVGGITGVRFATPAPQTTAMTTPLVGATNTGVFGTAMPQNNLGMVNNQFTQPTTMGFNTTPMANNGLPQNILAATGTVQPQQMTAQPMVNPLVQHYNMMNMVTAQPQMMNYSAPGVQTQPMQPMVTTPQFMNPVQPQVTQPYAGYNTTPMMTTPVVGAAPNYYNPQQMVQPMMAQPQVAAYPQTGYMQQPTMGYHMGYRY